MLISDNRTIQNKLFLFQEKQVYLNWNNTKIISGAMVRAESMTSGHV